MTTFSGNSGLEACILTHSGSLERSSGLSFWAGPESVTLPRMTASCGGAAATNAGAQNKINATAALLREFMAHPPTYRTEGHRTELVMFSDAKRRRDSPSVPDSPNTSEPIPTEILKVLESGTREISSGAFKR